jgi:hypothetical protein
MKTNREKLSEVLEKRGYKNEDLINEIEQIYNKQQLPIHGVIERLPIGTEVTIIDHEDWGEQRNTKKTITGYTDFGKKQGYLLDGVGIYLIEDFKANVL